MIINAAQLPGTSDQDRVIKTSYGVIVLDGATSFDPSSPSANDYVDSLGHELQRRFARSDDLRVILADAITATSRDLQLRPGLGPSSTVALVRLRANTVEVLVLGDSTVVVGHYDGSQQLITDHRLDQLELPQAEQYRHRLASGSGYDDIHRELLSALQQRQRIRRNSSNGYWIAEADPSAAGHAIYQRFPAESVAWAVLATDGASDPLTLLGIHWSGIAQLSSDELSELLGRCHTWEATDDPNGQQLPRPKRHDDKTLAVLRT
ncbi:protein phosphatase 2C domain-containing protein [Nocardia brasiliensis]|uniref:protein phosphatase 2C domain-containing protein n=1 Tax=Nocardia brasiliensis TaxID=37326 RepID=UPI0009DEFB3A|nr:protein phosphatase 2C domain-containing protein [Nocardia brasiliensis]